MNRIEKCLNILNQKRKKAFITYITAGLPTVDKSIEIIKAQYDAGVDIIEIGVPFSDPVADGPIIQEASYKAIQRDIDLKIVFDMVKEVRKSCEVPIVLMLYYNTILHYGVEVFIQKCIVVGVDGVIVPDLPYEEQYELEYCISLKKASPILIPLVSPVSKSRIPKILKDAKGFVYCISSMGVTGQKADFHKDVYECLKKSQEVAGIPVMLGFGIQKTEDVNPYKERIDGCIVGSAFMKILEDNNYDIAIMEKYIQEFKSGLN